MTQPSRGDLVDDCHAEALAFIEQEQPVWVAEYFPVLDAAMMAGVYGTLKILRDRGFIREERLVELTG